MVWYLELYLALRTHNIKSGGLFRAIQIFTRYKVIVSLFTPFLMYAIQIITECRLKKRLLRKELLKILQRPHNCIYF